MINSFYRVTMSTNPGLPFIAMGNTNAKYG